MHEPRGRDLNPPSSSVSANTATGGVGAGGVGGDGAIHGGGPEHRPDGRIRIVMFAANPTTTPRLALDEEAREISEKLRLSQDHDIFELTTCWAVRPADLLQRLNQHRPHVVHFSGHGNTTGDIVLSDGAGREHPVSAEALAELFRTMTDDIRVVVLNACYSTIQAQAISRHVDYVIGMHAPVEDRSAAVFAAAFYSALGFHRTVQEAFDQATTALMLHGLSDDRTPELIVRRGADPHTRLHGMTTAGRDRSDGAAFGPEFPPPVTVEGSARSGRRGAQGGPTRRMSDHEDERRVAAAVTRLAIDIHREWENEEDRRHIHDPYTLRVRWRNAAQDITDHWTNVGDRPPGAPDVEMDLSDELTNIVRVYDRLPRHRLVVLGAAGSGKTILTLRFALDLIARREDHEPVPVVVALASWDPTVTEMNDWLVEKMIEHHPFLASSLDDGSTLAATLLDRNRIVPILDGLDEIAEHMRGPALRGLNAHPRLPLLVTSRTAEYTAAVDHATVLKGAAVVQLCDLSVDDIADYLRRASRVVVRGDGTVESRWEPVISRLRERPPAPDAKVLLDVLSAPLMVSLARLVYHDSGSPDPSELLDAERFPTATSLAASLLDQFIPAAYDESSARWRAADALRWFELLAQRLQLMNTQEIAWWRFGDTIRRRSRMLLGAAVGVIGAGSLLAFAWQFGVGLGAGFGAGVAADRSPPPRRTPFSLRRRWAYMFRLGVGNAAGGLASSLLIARLRLGHPGYVVAYLQDTASRRIGSTQGYLIAAVACLGGLILAVTGTLLGRPRREPTAGEGAGRREWHELAEMAIYGAVAGSLSTLMLGEVGGMAMTLTMGLAMAVVVTLEKPIDVQTRSGPMDLLRTDRNNALFLLVGFAVAIGLPAGVALGTALGPAFGSVAALGGGVTIGLGVMLGLTAWGRWLLLARFWLPLTGQAPWALAAFLREAHRVGVLRQAGGVYQFRHVLLQQRLAAGYCPDHNAR